MGKVTSKQQVVLDFIQRYVAEHKKAPLIREIQEGCSITSYKSAVDRLNALERKGLIGRRPNKHRGIRVKKVSGEPGFSVEPQTLQGMSS